MGQPLVSLGLPRMLWFPPTIKNVNVPPFAVYIYSEWYSSGYISFVTCVESPRSEVKLLVTNSVIQVILKVSNNCCFNISDICYLVFSLYSASSWCSVTVWPVISQLRLHTGCHNLQKQTTHSKIGLSLCSHWESILKLWSKNAYILAVLLMYGV